MELQRRTRIVRLAAQFCPIHKICEQKQWKKKTKSVDFVQSFYVSGNTEQLMSWSWCSFSRVVAVRWFQLHGYRMYRAKNNSWKLIQFSAGKNEYFYEKPMTENYTLTKYLHFDPGRGSYLDPAKNSIFKNSAQENIRKVYSSQLRWVSSGHEPALRSSSGSSSGVQERWTKV